MCQFKEVPFKVYLRYHVHTNAMCGRRVGPSEHMLWHKYKKYCFRKLECYKEQLIFIASPKIVGSTCKMKYQMFFFANKTY